jgi:DNA-binding CsgD family transcriptional regulator/tetratricopeptide (TPR) repeat protein
MTRLFGRTRETGVLHDLLDHIDERGGALVVRGEAGIGKSALLAAARAHAETRGVQVLAVTGVQAEATLPFAGLHQLLRPILVESDALPERQREALYAAFGMTDARAPDLFLIALAALELLSGAASQAPLLLIVEDAHWLDRSTADALVFVARRLNQEPIVLLAAARDGMESGLIEAGLPELCLEGIDAQSAGMLLDAHAPDLPHAVRGRLLTEAAGNPLALVELPTALRSERGGGEAPFPMVLPLTTRLEQAFLARASGLPDAARTVLLVAAVDDGNAVVEVLRASVMIDGVESAEQALASAIQSGLVETDGTELWFRHPLVRSAIHQAASVAQRHAAHAALADVLIDQPDRSIWHRAAAVFRPDEAVASELETAAIRARHRGAVALAVAALERAARLADNPARRRDRLLRAAEMALGLGQRDLVARLVRETEPLQLSPVERAKMIWVQETIEVGRLGDPARERSLLWLARLAADEGDTNLALDLLWLVASRCWWANHDQAMRDLVVAEVDRMVSARADPSVLAILAFAAPVEQGRDVMCRLATAPPGRSGQLEAIRLAGSAAITLGAFDLAAGFLEASVTGLRPEGRLSHLARSLIQRAWAAVFLGNWPLAAQDLDEGERLARETAQPQWEAEAQARKAMLAGLRGEHDLAESLAGDAQRTLLPIGGSFILASVQWARGLIALGRGRPAEAYDHLQRMMDPGDPAYHYFMRCWVIADLAEAAVQSGHRDAVRAVMEELQSVAQQTPSPWLHVALRYARPLLADDEEAGALFQEGLSADMAAWPFYQARLQLAYGTWLRRRRRAVESRALLRAARDTFDALGAMPWGERARQELRASGETSRQRAVDVWDQLSPQELQIAQMAARGLSNREIGQRLFLSHRTVGFHLYRIFPKLGITSRSELRAALRASAPASV